jgi:hypothetical protein
VSNDTPRSAAHARSCARLAKQVFGVFVQGLGELKSVEGMRL